MTLSQIERDWIRWQAERSYPWRAAQVTARWIADAERGIYAGTIPQPWTCDCCGTVYRERPLIEGVAGCPNCGNYMEGEE